MRRFAAIVSCLVAPLAACGGGEHPGDDEHYDCTMETRDDEFVVGLEKVSPSGTHFVMRSSLPAPPGRGDNTIVVGLMDSSAAPMAGASLTVRPFMPDHGHGTAIPVVITESATVIGDYTLDPVNFHMPGLWQILISAGAVTDANTAVFSFCVPG
jgi:hypothetical protein